MNRASDCYKYGVSFSLPCDVFSQKNKCFRYLRFQVLRTVNGILSYDLTPCILLEIY